MSVLTRLRAYAGLWSLVAVLGLAVVFLAAAAAPVATRIEDRALRQMVAEAPYRVRDLTFTAPVRGQDAATGAAGTLSEVLRKLPEELSDRVDAAWGVQRTTLVMPNVTDLSGDGVDTGPDGLNPVVTLHHQTDLAPELTIVAGAAPTADAEVDPITGVIEVMTSVAVAETLGLRVGGEYLLRGAGSGSSPPGRGIPALRLRLTGLFTAGDPAAPVWQHAPRLLSTGLVIFDGTPPTMARTATFVTSQESLTASYEAGLNTWFEQEYLVRVRLDERRLDAAGVTGVQDAVARVRTDRRLSELRKHTGLEGLIDEFLRRAAAVRALLAVVVAGLVGSGGGLLVLAARLTADRRRGELVLLRARGASRRAVVGRLGAEAALVVLPAAAAGWLLYQLVDRRVYGPPAPAPAPAGGSGLRDRVWQVLAAVEWLPLVVAVAAVLAVPAAVALVLREGGGTGRRDVSRHRPAPVRVTIELLVVLLAGLGVLLLHRRGLTVAGVDPYLSLVPVLIGLAAGLLALRWYPWPLRALGAVAARRRGAVGFLALARAGRAAPAAALPLLVLVLAVSLGGFAGAVQASVVAARADAAVQAVGAHARVGADRLGVDAVAQVAAVPGVTAATGAHREGVVRSGGRTLPGVAVVVLDTVAYQEILAALGVGTRLPEAMLAATPGAGPVPVLAPAQVAERGELAVRIGDETYPVVVVGDSTTLPGPDRHRSWVLVPRQALPAAALPDAPAELLVAGADADLAAVRAAAAGASGLAPQELAVTALASYRAELEASGFNRGLTVAFLTGTVGGAVAGLIAVALALVVPAAARGHALSLLRTMGLSARQARTLLLLELLPLVSLAVLVGAVVGVALPLLLGPALGLAEFTAGVPVAIGVDLGTVGLLAALVVALAVVGVLVEAAANRRLGLGGVLRVDSR